MQSNLQTSSNAAFPSGYGLSEDSFAGSFYLSSSDTQSAQESSESSSIAISTELVQCSQKRAIRSHRKTRQGCFNCKRRKVKCTEERPFCLPCSRNGLRCVYPATREASMFPLPFQVAVPQAQSMRELHSGRLEYTALDMRLLHHFILDAYPHLPLDCDDIWTRDVPALAHQFNYLMHSILAVSASHLVRCGKHSMVPAAYFHRLRAIEGVNQALNKEDRSADEDDVLVSACYALCFQNAHISESSIAFWVTVRSIASLGHELSKKKRLTRFQRGITITAHAQLMTRRLENIPNMRKDLVLEAITAIDAVEPLCVDGIQNELHNLLRQELRALLRSSLEAYFWHSSIYAFVATMDPLSFERFSDPNEHVIQILQCHFLAIQMLMAPILMNEWKGRAAHMKEKEPEGVEEQKDTSSFRWSETICTLPPDHPWRNCLAWTETIQARANSGELYEDFFEDPAEPSELDEVVDCREARGAWTERLGFPDSDSDAARKDYEDRVKGFERRVVMWSKDSDGQQSSPKVPHDQVDEELADTYGQDIP